MIKLVIKMDVKKIILVIFLLLATITYARAQTVVAPVNPTNPNTPIVPVCNQADIIAKFQQEEQATRKFVLDTFNQKTQDFFNQADMRINYLENEYKSQLRRMTITLGFLWFFITLVTVSLYSYLSVKLQQKRYRQMKSSIEQDVRRQVAQEISNRLKEHQSFTKPTIDMPDQSLKEIEMAEKAMKDKEEEWRQAQEQAKKMELTKKQLETDKQMLAQQMAQIQAKMDALNPPLKKGWFAKKETKPVDPLAKMSKEELIKLLKEGKSSQ
jgi:hypothetical protein